MAALHPFLAHLHAVDQARVERMTLKQARVATWKLAFALFQASAIDVIPVGIKLNIRLPGVVGASKGQHEPDASSQLAVWGQIDFALGGLPVHDPNHFGPGIALHS